MYENKNSNIFAIYNYGFCDGKSSGCLSPYPEHVDSGSKVTVINLLLLFLNIIPTDIESHFHKKFLLKCNC